MCGDVNKPVLKPCWVKACAVLREVLPLPLVPATCIDLNFCCGLPRLSANFSKLLSDKDCLGLFVVGRYKLVVNIL